MINKPKYQSNYLLLIVGIIVVFLFIPVQEIQAESKFNKLKREVAELKQTVANHLNGHQTNTSGSSSAESSVEVFVGDTPLPIPNDFKTAVEALDGKFIIIGNRDGKTVRLVSLEGVYYNPCFSESSGQVDTSVFNATTHICKFTGSLADTITLLKQRFADGGGGGTGCGTCTGGGKSRPCNKSTNTYECTGPIQGICSTNC